MPVVPALLACRRRESGMVAVLVAIFVVVILGFIALAVDSGHINDTAQQLQAAADSAALGAAAKLKLEASSLGGSYTQTRAAAVTLASRNKAAGVNVIVDANAGNSPGGDVVVGTWNAETSTFMPTTVSPNAVKVVARRTSGSGGGALETTFGAVLGSSTAEVSRTAIATYKAPPNPVILVLDPSATAALSLSGNAAIDAAGGRVQVNSNASCGIKVGGSAHLSADQVAVCGRACSGGSSSIGNLKEDADAVEDPLASLLPGSSDWTAQRSAMPMPAGANGQITGGGLFGPGYYPKGISVTSNTTIALGTGIYMFGGDVSLGGGTVLSGSGVTILLDESVQLSLGGGASIALTPPLTGSFEGVALMCHRGTSSGKTLDFGGNGSIAIEGTIYVPSGGISFSGTSGVQQYGQVICDRLDQSGNSRITGLHIAPSKAKGGSVTLVH